MGKIKVLHYIPGFNYGGIESRFIDTFKYVDKEKFEFHVMTFQDKEKNFLLKKFCNNGGIVQTIPRMKDLIKHIKMIDTVLKIEKYDIIHCYSPIGYLVMKIAKKNRIKVRILHARTSSFSGDKFPRVRKLLKKKTVEYSTCNLAVSEVAADWMFEGKESIILKNSIEVDNYKFNEEQRNSMRVNLNLNNYFVIGHIGRFTPAKNHHFLFKLLTSALKVNSQIKLLLVGPTYEEVEEYLIDKSILKNIVVVGYQTKPEDFLHAMDIFVFPSLYEGFPGTLLEAQVNGLNCIVSKNITPEIAVTSNIEFVDLKNSLNIWNEKLFCKKILDNRRSYDKEVKKAGFDIKDSVKELEKIYLLELEG